MHTLRVQTSYGELFDKLVDYDKKAGMREFNAVKKTATAYMKLLFPHWLTVEDINLEEFDEYCLQRTIHRRGVIQKQIYLIDREYIPQMPAMWVKIVDKHCH